MLLIIGLDGATWELAEPWIAEGRLPNLTRLRSQGIAGPLTATVPPATLPSWSTFMTGVNPGRHGVFDFTRRRFGTYDVEFVNATSRKSPTVWRMLSEAGKRVCVLGVPGTYPPEPINGYMISGFDTPVTTRADASFIHPHSLIPLVEKLGGFPFADFQEFRVGRGWYRTARARLLRGIDVKTRLAQHLLGSERWDCCMLLYGESDTAAHHFWKFHDPASPRFDAEGAAELGTTMREVYEALDAAIGVLCATVPDADVLIASDHGFGGAGGSAVYLNRSLEHMGLQRRFLTHNGVAGAAKRLALRAVPARLQARAFRLRGGRWASRLESRARFAGIDWTRTRAFSEELSYFPNVWINLKGREPEGTVDRRDYERVRDDVIAGFEQLRHPVHGGRVVRRAWRREELYHGPMVPSAPDVILELHLERGYSYTCLPSSTVSSGTVVRVLDAAEWRGGKLAGLSGAHRAQGLFVLRARAVAAPRRVSAHIADLAPTMLRLCDVNSSVQFDGTTLVAGGASGGSHAPAAGVDEYVYSAAENEEIASRLGALGYLQ